MTTYLVGALGDEMTINGILLAGGGMRDAEGKTNYSIVTPQTPVPEL